MNADYGFFSPLQIFIALTLFFTVVVLTKCALCPSFKQYFFSSRSLSFVLRSYVVFVISSSLLLSYQFYFVITYICDVFGSFFLSLVVIVTLAFRNSRLTNVISLIWLAALLLLQRQREMCKWIRK